MRLYFFRSPLFLCLLGFAGIWIYTLMIRFIGHFLSFTRYPCARVEDTETCMSPPVESKIMLCHTARYHRTLLDEKSATVLDD
jgi:hypothetical protein